MELNEMEKKLLFQVEGDYQTKILNELYMTVRYSNNSEQREAAEGLMAKLRVLSNAECMDLVKDIQKNYRLPYPARTIGEKIAEARQQSGAEKLKGHDIMALERFDPEVKHMIVFDVLSYDSPVGDKGDKMRLFLTDAGYQKFLESQERGEVKLKNHAKVSDGKLPRRAEPKMIRLDEKQYRAVKKMTRAACANNDCGNCLLLDDGETCVCVQSISYSLLCRYFREAVLPADRQLCEQITRSGETDLKRCAVCGSTFAAGSNRAKYCPDCAAKIRRRQKAQSERNRRLRIKTTT